MREIDQAFTEWSFLGVRQMRNYLRLMGYSTGIKRIRRLMRLMGLMPIYRKPRTSIPNPEHIRYPYLLRDVVITRPNQVWCADITYIPMHKGFLYLVAIMDWHSRKVLSWRLSNTMDVDFCVAALEEALAKHGKPAIFNTDQGSQFTSFAFTNALRENGIRISMDGRGHWLDNVFIERLWRSLRYECVYLNAFGTDLEARAGIGRWIDFYNRIRPHTALGHYPGHVP
jgi:putative transposase